MAFYSFSVKITYISILRRSIICWLISQLLGQWSVTVDFHSGLTHYCGGLILVSLVTVVVSFWSHSLLWWSRSGLTRYCGGLVLVSLVTVWSHSGLTHYCGGLILVSLVTVVVSFWSHSLLCGLILVTHYCGGLILVSLVTVWSHSGLTRYCGGLILVSLVTVVVSFWSHSLLWWSHSGSSCERWAWRQVFADMVCIRGQIFLLSHLFRTVP